LLATFAESKLRTFDPERRDLTNPDLNLFFAIRTTSIESCRELCIRIVSYESMAATEAKTRDVIFDLKGDVEVKFLDHGFVRLVDCTPRVVPADSIGIESRIVDAARVSYGGGTKKAQTDLALLAYLYRHEHMTPFEMVDFTFAVRVPMFVAKQHMRHRTFSYNEESARYSVIEDLFYLPMPSEVRAQSTKNRQGSDEEKKLGDVAQGFSEAVSSLGASAFSEYGAAVGNGVAREMARIILPEGRYTKYYFKGNLRNLLHFLELRMDSHAQKEIQLFAEAIYSLVKRVAPHAVDVYERYTRGAMKLTAQEVEVVAAYLDGDDNDLDELAEGGGGIDGKISGREKEEWLEKVAKFIKIARSRFASRLIPIAPAAVPAPLPTTPIISPPIALIPDQATPAPAVSTPVGPRKCSACGNYEGHSGAACWLCCQDESEEESPKLQDEKAPPAPSAPPPVVAPRYRPDSPKECSMCESYVYHGEKTCKKCRDATEI
jgi:thymidylate synthase (FAD)